MTKQLICHHKRPFSHIWNHEFNNFLNVLEQLCIRELEEKINGEDDA